MGTRSKGGYKCEENRILSHEKNRPSEKSPKKLVLSKFRRRTRKYRRIR